MVSSGTVLSTTITGTFPRFGRMKPLVWPTVGYSLKTRDVELTDARHHVEVRVILRRGEDLHVPKHRPGVRFLSASGGRLTSDDVGLHSRVWATEGAQGHHHQCAQNEECEQLPGLEETSELETLSRPEERDGSGDGFDSALQLTGDGVEQLPTLREEVERRQSDHSQGGDRDSDAGRQERRRLEYEQSTYGAASTLYVT